MPEIRYFYPPSSDEPRTHIIKFAQTRFSYVPENEFICSLLLKSCGLPVPNSQLIKINSQYHYVIERYDPDPELKLRFYQEDFCQALGVSRKNKYERDSGLKFKNIFNKLKLILDSKNASIHLD